MAPFGSAIRWKGETSETVRLLGPAATASGFSIACDVYVFHLTRPAEASSPTVELSLLTGTTFSIQWVFLESGHSQYLLFLEGAVPRQTFSARRYCGRPRRRHGHGKRSGHKLGGRSGQGKETRSRWWRKNISGIFASHLCWEWNFYISFFAAV